MKSIPLHAPRTFLAGASCACVAIVLCSMGARTACAREAAAPVDEYLVHIAQRLGPQPRAALRRIEGAPRRLLAARSYLRMADDLAERWSWSQAQIEAFAGTPEYRALLAEVAQVREAFERQNPGYTLYANTQARSFDVQLRRWNENTGVGRTALHLHRAAQAELRRGYPAAADAAAAARFAEFLRSWRPAGAAPLAAPGLSLHGQSRAIDFQIVKGGEIVAGTQIASVRKVWEGQGWARKLRLAVADADFIGPLTSPNEPWHYQYAPKQSRASTVASVGIAAGHQGSSAQVR